MVGNQLCITSITKVGIGGKIDAAAVALGPVVSDGGISYFGRAFQQQAAAAIHIVIETSETLFNAAVVNLKFPGGHATMPAHRTSIVVCDMRVIDAKGYLVVANGSDGAVGIVDSSGTAHGKLIGAENLIELTVLDNSTPVIVVVVSTVGLHSEDR